MTARAAAAATATLALAGMAAAILFKAPLSPTWPSSPVTVPGVWSIDAVSAVPIGDPLHRAAAVAVCLTAIAAALTARALTRLGHEPLMSAGVTLAIGLLSYGSLALAVQLPATLAAALTAAAVLVAIEGGRHRHVRAATSALLQLAAGALQPAAFAALPLIVAHAWGRSTIARALAGLLGVVATGWAVSAAAASVADGEGFDLMNRPWLWPLAVIMAGHALSPLWGRQADGTALVGTAVMVSMIEAGHQASALAVFPALLLAAGLASLPAPSRGARMALVTGLVAIALAEAWRLPPSEPWALVAWRDAVERVVPAGTRIHTGNVAAVALSGPLFHGRPSRIAIVGPAPVAGAGPTEPRYVLEDLAGGTPPSGHSAPVPLSHEGAADYVARLPAGTIVGMAIAVSDPDVGLDAARAALALVGHREAPAGSTAVAVGILGKAPAAGLVRDDGRLHVLIGDPLGADGQRSPTDFDLRVAPDGVSVQLRGRVLATGRRWAVIALRPGGPLIDAMADAGGQPPWPIRLPGLQLYRTQP